MVCGEDLASHLILVVAAAFLGAAGYSPPSGAGNGVGAVAVAAVEDELAFVGAAGAVVEDSALMAASAVAVVVAVAAAALAAVAAAVAAAAAEAALAVLVAAGDTAEAETLLDAAEHLPAAPAEQFLCQ